MGPLTAQIGCPALTRKQPVTMRTSHVAAALCVLATLVVVPASVIAADLPTAESTMLFSEWFHSQKAGPSSRAKVLSEKEKPETKHICLQETRQYNCRYVGCPNFEKSFGNEADPTACNATSVSCVNCRQGTVFQSDLTCCVEEDSYSSYGEEHRGFGSGVRSPILKIGTCDWDVNLHRDGLANGTRQSIIENGKKIGDAWATCYLTAGSEYCHDLLCDKMVLTFQGGVYQALVKSTLPNDLQTAYPELSCLTEESFDATISDPNARVARNGTTTTLYEGEATVMSGFVTITSLDRSIEFTHGYMDYVAQFTPVVHSIRNNGGASSTAGLAVVTPNTYNIKLVGKKPQAYSFTGKKVSQ